MRNNRITSIALIFMLIGVFLWTGLSYSSDISCLRVPIDKTTGERMRRFALIVAKRSEREIFDEKIALDLVKDSDGGERGAYFRSRLQDPFLRILFLKYSRYYQGLFPKAIALTIDDPEKIVRLEALRIIQQNKIPGFDHEIVGLLTNENEHSDIKVQACKAIAILKDEFMGVEGLGEILRKFLRNPNKSIRAEAAEAIGAINYREAEGDLVDLLYGGIVSGFGPIWWNSIDGHPMEGLVDISDAIAAAKVLKQFGHNEEWHKIAPFLKPMPVNFESRKFLELKCRDPEGKSVIKKGQDGYEKEIGIFTKEDQGKYSKEDLNFVFLVHPEAYYDEEGNIKYEFKVFHGALARAIAHVLAIVQYEEAMSEIIGLSIDLQGLTYGNSYYPQYNISDAVFNFESEEAGEKLLKLLEDHLLKDDWKGLKRVVLTFGEKKIPIHEIELPALIETLGSLKYKKAAPVLLKLLDRVHTDRKQLEKDIGNYSITQLVTAILYSLAFMDYQEAVPVMVKEFNSKFYEIAAGALNQMFINEDTKRRIGPVLVKLLEKEENIEYVVKLLGKIGYREAGPALLDLLDYWWYWQDKHPGVSRWGRIHGSDEPEIMAILEAIGKIGYREAGPKLLELLQSKKANQSWASSSNELQEAIVRTVGEIFYTEATPDLIKLLKERPEYIRIFLSGICLGTSLRYGPSDEVKIAITDVLTMVRSLPMPKQQIDLPHIELPDRKTVDTNV